MSVRLHHIVIVFITISLITVGVSWYVKSNAQISEPGFVYTSSSPSLTPPVDTDSDGILDSDEVNRYHTNPLVIDTDTDGLSDYDEIKVYHSNPLLPDTNHDNIADGEAVQQGFSPSTGSQTRLDSIDTDGDELYDSIELKLGTDLNHSDTDSDGIPDGIEVRAGSNPLVGGEDRSVERHVEVDLTHQQLHYFMNNVELGTMPVSTGLPSKPTPPGEFSILRKIPVARYVNTTPGDEYDLPNVHWNLEFKRSYFFHEAYWHNQFGIRPMSHGCTNMRLADVAQLYQFLDVGDRVIIYGKTPVGRVKKEGATANP